MADCLFCKIVDGNIPAKVLHRDEHCLGFADISPQAPLHVLLIPLRHIPSLKDATIEDREVLGHLMICAQKLAEENGYGDSGYRVVMNTGADAGQTVFHVHLHLLAGRKLGWPPG